MRIFYFDTDKSNLSLLHDSSRFKQPSKELNFPPEIVQKIVDNLPRSCLPLIASVNRVWYAIAMKCLYKHVYIRTLPHWLLFVRSFRDNSFASQFGQLIQSIILKPSPKLIPSQLMSALNQQAIENDDTIQPYLKGYSRLQRVDYNCTGLEDIDKPMPIFENDQQQQQQQQQQQHENYTEIDTTKKEAEWLFHVLDADIIPVLKYASQLAYLDVSGCENLSDQVLLTIAAAKKQHPNPMPMIGLWMSILRKCTPSGIRQLIAVEKQCQLERKLKYLDIGFQVSMTDDAIKDIATYWGPSLIHIRLNSIYQLSDMSVKYITSHCPNLRLIHLVRCWQMNNESLRLLGKHCKKLTYVSVSFLSRTNEEGIKHLIQSCPELLWLDITGCSINPLFKSIIVDSWKVYRIQHHLPPVYFQDGALNLI